MTAKRKMKVLVIASVASMHDNFNRENINILLDMGCDVTVAANFHTEEDINSQEKIDGFVKEMRAKGVHTAQVGFTRKTGNPVRLAESARQVGKLLEQRFDMVHCHAPICAVLTRLAYRKYRKKYGGRLVYTAHGFHFYKGAPLKNWLLYYPVEWLCSWWTDVLITINREDYRRAKRWLHAKRTVYIPGVGVDTKRFQKLPEYQKEAKRKELGVLGDVLLLASVGELNTNKNHQIVIRAVAELNDSSIHYIIAGQGSEYEHLKNLAEDLGIGRQVHLLGYRNDIEEIYAASDICVFPSIREGLGLAAIEGMAAGLPLIISNNRGARDFAVNNKNALVCNPVSVSEFSNAIAVLKDSQMRVKFGKKNVMISKKFDFEEVSDKMESIYSFYA